MKRNPATSKKPLETMPRLAHVRPPETGDVALTDVAAIACYVIVGLALGLFFILRTRIGSVAGNEMTVDRACFTVTSAATLTGFRLATPLSDLKLPAQAAALALMSASALATLILSAWSLSLLLGFGLTGKRLIRGAIIGFVTLALFAAAVALGDQNGFFPTLFQSVSALSNCGLSVGSLPDPGGWRTQLVMLPLASAGSIGILVLADLADSIRTLRRLRPITVTLLALAAGSYLIGSGGIALCQVQAHVPLPDAALQGSTMALNARTLGFPLYALESSAPAARWILLGLMGWGGTVGGCGGGVGGAAVGLWSASIAQDGLKRKSDLVNAAIIWIGLYLALCLTCVVCLSISRPADDAYQLLFVSVSAASCCGLSAAPINLTGSALYTLSATMLIGRLLPVGLLLTLATRWRRSQSLKP